MPRLTVPVFCSRKLRIWVDHSLVIVCIWGSVCLFGLVFTQPHIFLEAEECQNSLFEATSSTERETPAQKNYCSMVA